MDRRFVKTQREGSFGRTSTYHGGLAYQDVPNLCKYSSSAYFIVHSRAKQMHRSRVTINKISTSTANSRYDIPMTITYLHLVPQQHLLEQHTY